MIVAKLHSHLVTSSLLIAAIMAFASGIQGQTVLDQQQTIFTSDAPVAINATQDLAQTVTAGITGALTKLSMPVGCSISSPANAAVDGLLVEIQGVTAGGLPNGIVLTSQTFPANTLPPTGGALFFVDLVFSSPISMSVGQKFAIVLRPNTTGVDCAIAYGSGSDVYLGGTEFCCSTSLWTDQVMDLPFETWVTISSPIGATGTSANPSGATNTTVNQTTTQAVNTATGNTYITFSDLIVPGKGLRFSFIRSYNDQDPYSGPLLRGWTHSYNILLTQDAISGAVTIKEADGHQNIFVPGAISGTYVPPVGVYDVLAMTGTNTFTLTRPNQTVFLFGPIPPNPLIIRLLSITDKNMNVQTLSYNASGNLVSFMDVGGGVFTFTYDAANHLLSLLDGALSRTYTYGNDGTNLTTYTDAAGKMSNYSYTISNLLTVAMDPLNHTAISNTFDSQGRVTQTNRIVGSMTCTTTYAYDDINHITTITDPLANVTKHYYDGARRLIKIVNALGFQTTFTYDSNNNLITITNQLGKTTTYTYDGQGNRLSSTDPLGNQTLFMYDANHNVTMETDANGNGTTFGYDAHGNLISITDALSGVTTYTYDPRGNKLTFKNAKGNTTTYTYDAGNHVLTVTDPALKTTTFTYDAGGRLATQTEAAGNSKTLGYDVLSRLTSMSYAVGASGLASAGTVAYTYDANGNRTGMTDSSGTTIYSYDAENRLTSASFPGGVVAYTYDCNNNRTSLSYAVKVLNYTYDALNRLTAVADGAKITHYTYDATNNLLGIAYPNGASVGYSYDAAKRLTQVRNTYTGSSGNPISSFTYVLDKVGNRTQVTDGSGNVTAFTYDKLYRLLKTTVVLKSSAYSYDAVGNRLTANAPSLSIGYTYDAADKLLSAGPTTFVYDANGNQISQKTGPTTITYGFDTADRLVSVMGGTSPASSFTYDGDGNRISQKVGAATYTYLNDITNEFTTVLDEMGPDGHIQYVRGRGLISADSPAFTYYYHYDSQATVAGVTDTTGHLAERYVYDVWGQRQLTVPNPGIGTQNKFGYTGEALDPGTGLYYLHARYYDPTLARFVSKDPFPGFDRSPQTLNRFVYVRNNPATLTDRTGFCALDPDDDLDLDPDLFPCPTPGPP
jgi:RHS repeat-associated protein